MSEGVFSNSAFGFSIAIPRGWYVLNADAFSDEALRLPAAERRLVITKYPEPYPDLNPCIVLIIRPLGSNQHMSAKEIMIMAVDTLQKATTDCVVEDPVAETRLCNLHAATTRLRYSREVTPGRVSRIVVRVSIVLRGDTMFQISMTGKEEGDDLCDTEFKQAFSSLQIEETSAVQELPVAVRLANVVKQRFEMTQVMRDEEIESAIGSTLNAAGLSRVAISLAKLTKRCARVKRKNRLDDSIPIGASKIGGWPDLPEHVEWPRWRDTPLTFIAQVNLADVSSCPSCRALPQEGLLSFFYDAEQTTWGFDPKDRGSWRVLHTTGAMKRLRRCPRENDEEPGIVYDSSLLDFIETLSLPGPETIPVNDLSLTNVELDVYFDFLAGLMGGEEEVVDQLFGYPLALQGDMQLECQLVSNGLYCGDATGYQDPRRTALEVGASEWTLILQISSDEEGGMMWGDGGRLYFWMRASDLTARRFDDAWMILQGC